MKIYVVYTKKHEIVAVTRSTEYAMSARKAYDGYIVERDIILKER